MTTEKGNIRPQSLVSSHWSLVIRKKKSTIKSRLSEIKNFLIFLAVAIKMNAFKFIQILMVRTSLFIEIGGLKSSLRTNLIGVAVRI